MEQAIPMKRPTKADEFHNVAPKLSESDDEGGRTLDITVRSRAAERKLLMKLDLHIIPILFVLFLLAFIDRINIGNARIQGLEKDLGMVGNDFNIALFVFFIPYILLEVPSNILLKKLAPSTWLSAIMFFWGKSSMLYPNRIMSSFTMTLKESKADVKDICRHNNYLPRRDSLLRWPRGLSCALRCLRSGFLPR
jgi:hypothetical protein